MSDTNKFPEYVLSKEQVARIGGEGLKKLNERKVTLVPKQTDEQRKLANAWAQGAYYVTNGKYEIDPADNPYGEADD